MNTGIKLPDAVVPDEMLAADPEIKRRMAAGIRDTFAKYGGPVTVFWAETFGRICCFQAQRPKPVLFPGDRELITYLPSYYYGVLDAEKRAKAEGRA